MDTGHNYDSLVELLGQPSEALQAWVAAFGASSMRLPGAIDMRLWPASLEPIVHALAGVVAPDRLGRRPADLHFLPGAQALREVEKAVSFAAANLAVDGFSGFDVGALFFTLRDVLCRTLEGPAADEMQRYMEWLVVLAADSLATGREQAAIERWHDQLDEGTPLVMITPELPAALFVCQPDRRVVASVFGRLLLTVVRTGGEAVIIDVRGVAGRMQQSFAEGLETFVGHSRVAKRIQIFVCGVHTDDRPTWEDISVRHGADMHFETHFDSCVAAALKVGGWRLVGPS